MTAIEKIINDARMLFIEHNSLESSFLFLYNQVEGDLRPYIGATANIFDYIEINGQDRLTKSAQDYADEATASWTISEILFWFYYTACFPNSNVGKLMIKYNIFKLICVDDLFSSEHINLLPGTMIDQNRKLF